MSADRTFTLIGRFDDQITKHLVAINKEIASFGKGLKVVGKDADRLGKSVRSLNDETKRFTRTFERVGRGAKGAFSSVDTSLGKVKDSMKGVQGGLQDMKAGFAAASQDSAASIRGIADAFQDVVAAANNAADAAKGIGADGPSFGSDKGDRGGYTVRKGVYANLIASGVQTIAGTAISVAGKAVGAVGGKVQEAVRDELSDIATAGGIFSMGKIGKVKWADTYEKAFQVQRELENRMAKLAAALPGETDDYARNAKMVSDTVMNIGMKAGPEFVKMMQGFDGAVKNSKDAFLSGTEQLAKFATLTDVISPSGGLPFNALVEQLMTDEKLNPAMLKRRYNAIKRNPLLSGAIDRNLEELNKAAAGTPERFKAMLTLLKEMYPPEVINAMQNSVDGVTQTMKSTLFSMNTGLFGLKREITIATEGFDTMHAGKEIKTTLYDMGAKIYAAIGTVLNPILEALPMILDPIGQAMDVLKEMYFNAENTLSNFQAAYKKFGAMRFDGKALSALDIGFRASMETIAKLAKAFGGDAKKIADLEGMLGGETLDFGAAITKAMDALFSSDAMDRLGFAIGKAAGTIFTDIAKMIEGAGKVVDQSGLVAGLKRGWDDAKGTESFGKVLGEGFKIAFKLLAGIVIEAVKKAPFETTVIVGLVTGVLPSIAGEVTARVLGKVSGAITKSIAGSSLGSFVTGTALPAVKALMVGIGAKITAVLAGVLPAIQAAATGAAALTQTVVGGFLGFLKGLGGIIATTMTRVLAFLAPLANPVTIAAGIVVAVAAVVYVFKDQIRAGLEAVTKWIKANFQGPLKDALLGVTRVWKGIVNVIVGSIDWLIGLVTRDEKRMKQGGKAVSEGVRQFFSGWKQVLSNAIGAMLQAGKMWLNWVAKAVGDATKALFTRIANGIKGALTGLNALQGNFMSTIGRALMGLASRVFSWLTGIPMPGQPQTNPDGKQPPGAKPKSTLPVPAPVNAGIDIFNWLKDRVQPPPKATPQFDGAGRSMPLLKAIQTEMANKPTGSDLVIANSSETVIPAADGWMPKAFSAADGFGDGLKKVFAVVGTGFKAVGKQYETLAKGVNGYADATEKAFTQSERTSSERYGNLTSKMSGYQRETQQQFAAINSNLKTLASQVASMNALGGGAGGGFFGTGAGGGGVSKVIAVGKMLQGMGLNVAENPAFGNGRVGQHAPNSYHYSGRAIDVTGPTALLDQAYAKLKGTNPAELLWRTAGHYDHLHVAYAMGAGRPAFFNSMQAAREWEMAQMGDARIASVTTNSREMANEVTVNVGGVHVTTQGVTNTDELASIVAIKIGEAVNDAVAASIFA